MVKVLFKVKIFCVFLCLTTLCEAKVKLPSLISDGMVLQREQVVQVWGFADPGENILLNFRKKKYTTEADANGNWRIALPAMKAGGPYTMTINDIEVKDILIGDVYLCAGQSNIELPMSRVTDLYLEEVSTYSNPMIRYLRVPITYNHFTPQAETLPTSWKELTPANAMSFSAVAYFFAKEMYAKDNVAIGLINTGVGGSPVEAWISEEGLKPFPAYLNEREVYRSEEYVAEIRKVDQMKNRHWNSVLYAGDPGINETPKWFDAAYNDAEWATVDLFDTSWNNNGKNTINGSHWFRKEVNIPADKAGKAAVLRMGCIVDADSIFVNGVFVGTTAYEYPPRIYTLPEGLLKAGKNTITVRVIGYGNRAHFVPEKPYKIVFDDSEVSLEGNWKYKLGAPMPAMRGGVGFQNLPVGLYNSMIVPIAQYAVKGTIWYQGESNVTRYNEYYDMLTTMIAVWRETFGLPELPFAIIELAQFGHPSNTHMQKEWDTFRAVQKKVAEDTPNAVLVPAKDLGEWNDIHPLNKKDVGIRTAEKMRTLFPAK